MIFTHLIDRVVSRHQDSTQTLILVHRRELVEQAAKHCQNTYPSKSVDIEMGNLHATGFADITVASVLSIISGDRLQKFDPKRFKLVLVDEAHHIVAASYLRVLEHFGLETPRESSPALVGVSATLSRFDGLALGTVIDQIVYHKDYVDMIEEKWLTDARFTTVNIKADLRKVKSAASGDFLSSSLSQAINTPAINLLTVRAWMERAGERKSTLVFCVDVAHVRGLTETFRDHGIDARSIVGTDLIRDRDATLDAFKRQEFPVLLNCAIFTEGTDIPNIDCVLLARPTKSRNLLVQMIGRGMRLHSGKEDCHIIDLVSSLQTGIVSTPTLFGLDPAEILKEATADEMRSLRDRKQAGQSMNDSTPSTTTEPSVNLVLTDYDSVQDLIEDTSGERHIRAISKLAWVQVALDRYILSADNNAYLTIEKVEEDKFQVRYNAKVPRYSRAEESKWIPYARPRELAVQHTLSDAVHSADTFAKNTFVWRMIALSQSWRKDPATEGQLDFLNKYRGTDEQLTASDISKGRAGDMITKMKFGAKGRFDRIKAVARKHEREEGKHAKQQKMLERETVRVGPLHQGEFISSNA